MKTKAILNLIQALLFNFIVAVLVAVYFSMSILFAACIVVFAAILLGIVKHKYKSTFVGSLYAGLLKEIWIDRIMEKFYSNDMHLTRSQDMTQFVENNTINLADAGVDPDVLINNTDYPVDVVERTDAALALPLDYYDTVNTVVRDAEAVQLSYPKLDSVIRGHQKTLRQKCSAKATHSWAPSADGANTPVLSTTGAARVDGSGFKQMTLADLARGQQVLDLLDVPSEGRILVLHPTHKAELVTQDTTLLKAFANLKAGEILPLFGFEIYSSMLTAKYNYSTGAKKAFDAAAAGTDSVASQFYSEAEVMRADGTVKLFDRVNDPEARGTIVGYQKRFVGLSIRGKYTGAIFSYHA